MSVRGLEQEEERRDQDLQIIQTKTGTGSVHWMIGHCDACEHKQHFQCN